jgi:hypothetical protein
MDSGLRTPLLDSFRRGDAPRDAKILAAQGALAPRAHEQLALLALLSIDDDPDVAGTAEVTLKTMPAAGIAAFLARTDAPPELREFFAARGIRPATTPAPDGDAPLFEVGEVPVAPADEEAQSTLQRLASMNVAQRMAVAMKGTREERAVLIRDANKLVCCAVLSSPKLTETEVEGFAKMGSMSEEVLRIIAQTRAWMKRYGVVLALVKNPKTQVALSMNMLARLNDKDVRGLVTDRNVPDVLRLAARKRSKSD